MYAIKKIQIHLGLNQDFKQHSVYREILAISQVLHKHVVRYHACWIESVSPNQSMIKKATKKLQSDIKEKYKSRRRARKLLEKASDKESDDSMLDLDKLKDHKCINLKKAFKLNQDNMEILGEKWRGKNLLKIIEDDSEVCIDEDWANQKESSRDSAMLHGLQRFTGQRSESSDSRSEDEPNESDSDSESASLGSLAASKKSSKQEASFACRGEQMSGSEDDDADHGDSSSSESAGSKSCEETSVNSSSSLYQLMNKGTDFITLNVMI